MSQFNAEQSAIQWLYGLTTDKALYEHYRKTLTKLLQAAYDAGRQDARDAALEMIRAMMDKETP